MLPSCARACSQAQYWNSCKSIGEGEERHLRKRAEPQGESEKVSIACYEQEGEGQIPGLCDVL